MLYQITLPNCQAVNAVTWVKRLVSLLVNLEPFLNGPALYLAGYSSAKTMLLWQDASLTKLGLNLLCTMYVSGKSPIRMFRKILIPVVDSEQCGYDRLAWTAF